MRLYKLATIFVVLAAVIGIIVFVKLRTKTSFNAIKQEVESSLETKEMEHTEALIKEAKGFLETPQTLLLEGATEMYREQFTSALNKFDQAQMVLGKLPLKTQNELLPSLTFLSTTALVRKLGPFGTPILGSSTENNSDPLKLLTLPLARVLKDPQLSHDSRQFYEGLQAYISHNYQQAIEVWGGSDKGEKTNTKTQAMNTQATKIKATIATLGEPYSIEELAFRAAITPELQKIFLLLAYIHAENISQTELLLNSIPSMLTFLSEKETKSLLELLFNLYSKIGAQNPILAIEEALKLTQQVKLTPYSQLTDYLLQQLLLHCFEQNKTALPANFIEKTSKQVSECTSESSQQMFIRSLTSKLVEATSQANITVFQAYLGLIENLSYKPLITSFTASELNNFAINLFRERSVQFIPQILATIHRVDPAFDLTTHFIPYAQASLLGSITSPSVSNETLELMFDAILALSPSEQQLLELEEQMLNGISQAHMYLLIPGRPELIYTIANKIPKKLSSDGILELEDILHDLFLTASPATAKGELLPLLAKIEEQYDVNQHIKKTLSENIDDYIAAAENELLQGNYQTTTQLLKLLLGIDPMHQKLTSLAAETAFLNRDYQGAVTYLSQIENLTEHQKSILQSARTLEGAEISIDILEKLYTSGEISQEALFIQAFHLIKTNHYSDALQLFSRVGSSEEGGIGIALIKAFQGDWNQALTQLNQLSPRAALLTPALSLRIICALKLRYLSQAHAAFKRLNTPTLVLEASALSIIYSQAFAFCRKDYASGFYTLQVLDEPQMADTLFECMPVDSPWRYLARVRCFIEMQDLKSAQDLLQIVYDSQETVFSKSDLCSQYYEELQELEALLDIARYNFAAAQKKIGAMRDQTAQLTIKRRLLYALQDYSGWLHMTRSQGTGNEAGSDKETVEKEGVDEAAIIAQFRSLFPKEQLEFINAHLRTNAIPKAIGYAELLLQQANSSQGTLSQASSSQGALSLTLQFQLAKLIAPHTPNIATPILNLLKNSLQEETLANGATTSLSNSIELNKDTTLAAVELLHYFLEWNSLATLESLVNFETTSPGVLVAFSKVALAFDEEDWAKELLFSSLRNAPEFMPAEVLLASITQSNEQIRSAINLTQLRLTHVESQEPLKMMLSTLQLTSTQSKVTQQEQEEITYLLNELELYFKNLSKGMERSPQYIYWIGKCQLGRDERQSINTFQAALTLDPSYSMAAFAQGAAFKLSSLLVRSRQALMQGLVFEPKNSTAWKLLYQVDTALEDIYAQLNSSTQLTLLEPLNVQALQYQATAFLDLQDPKSAYATLEKAQVLEPGNNTTIELLDRAKKLLFRFR